MNGVICYNVSLEQGNIYLTRAKNDSYESAKETLENIEEIFKNFQRYLHALKKEITPKELFSIADTIQERYSFSKESSLSFSKKEEINAIFKRIERSLNNFQNFYSSIIPEKISENPAQDQTKDFSKIFLIKAFSQLETFFKKYPEASLKEELEEIISFKIDEINDEEILKKINEINTRINIDHLIKSFLIEEIYDPSFEELRLFLLERKAWKDDSQKLNAALVKACELNSKKSIKIFLDKGANGVSLLRQRARLGQESICMTLLDCGVNIDEMESENMKTALMLAIQGGHASLVISLLDRGANIEAVGMSGFTPLVWAGLGQNKHIAKILLERGANVNVQDRPYKRSALMRAILKGDVPLCKLLLKYKANPNIQDDFGDTALILAAGNTVLSEYLIENGADINTVSKRGWSPLTEAIKTGNKELLDTLIGRKVNVNAVNKEGQTALIFAIKTGNESLLKKLLELGADVNQPDKRKKTPLMYAIENGKLSMFNTLLSLGVQKSVLSTTGVQIEVRDVNGYTALMMAVQCGQEEMVQELLKNKVNVNIASKFQKETALMCAVRHGNQVIFDILLKTPRDFNMRDHLGNTALILATQQGHESMVRDLLRFGCDVNTVNNNGDTALMEAVKREDTSLCELLIKRGADVNLVNKEGHSPLSYAEKCGDEMFCKFFIDKVHHILKPSKGV